jgi:hypothetical protein
LQTILVMFADERARGVALEIILMFGLGFANGPAGRRGSWRPYIPGVFTSNSMLKRLAFLSGLLSPQSPSIEPPPVAP